MTDSIFAQTKAENRYAPRAETGAPLATIKVRIEATHKARFEALAKQEGVSVSRFLGAAGDRLARDMEAERDGLGVRCWFMASTEESSRYALAAKRAGQSLETFLLDAADAHADRLLSGDTE